MNGGRLAAGLRRRLGPCPSGLNAGECPARLKSANGAGDVCESEDLVRLLLQLRTGRVETVRAGPDAVKCDRERWNLTQSTTTTI